MPNANPNPSELSITPISTIEGFREAYKNLNLDIDNLNTIFCSFIIVFNSIVLSPNYAQSLSQEQKSELINSIKIFSVYRKQIILFISKNFPQDYKKLAETLSKEGNTPNIERLKELTKLFPTRIESKTTTIEWHIQIDRVFALKNEEINYVLSLLAA